MYFLRSNLNALQIVLMLIDICSTLRRITQYTLSLDFAEWYFETISKRELLLNIFKKLLSFPCLS